MVTKPLRIWLNVFAFCTAGFGSAQDVPPLIQTESPEDTPNSTKLRRSALKIVNIGLKKASRARGVPLAFWKMLLLRKAIASSEFVGAHVSLCHQLSWF